MEDNEILEFNFKYSLELSNMTEESYNTSKYIQYLSSPIVYKKESDEYEIIIEEEIGRIELIYLHGTKAFNNNLDIVDICDDESQELYEYSSCIYHDGYIDEKYNECPRSYDVLILDRIKIDKSYQGRDFGLIISRKVIDMFGYNCGAVLVKPFPLQHSSAARRESVLEEKYLSEKFDKDTDSCIKKMTKYWKKINKNCIQIKIKDGEIMLCIPQS